ncbi:PAAR domain-containing protein [Eleftheria terrae]|uniref:PAAR domain-containing protein n=1 Tax=Eleftheria terrae TaxID=1597781 RepID=UPI00263B5EC4|nr:PAAR domain-containing protein [Eleftheria terrae]WKB54541.1 PAAR domain-containing protein [Eleftheria terrae]
MSKRVIRVGDPTSHGGTVLSSGASHFTVDGIAVALVGDPCSCPKKGHGPCSIATGDPEHTIDGVPVAYEGCLTTCGASLLSTVPNFSKG